MKQQELKTSAVIIGIPRARVISRASISIGKQDTYKREKYNKTRAILDNARNISKQDDNCFEKTLATMTTIDDIYTTNTHVAIAKHIISNIAFGRENHTCGKACYQLVCNYYNETIFDDITSAILETFVEYWNTYYFIYNNRLVIGNLDTNDRTDMILTDETTKAIIDSKRKAWNVLYSAVEKTLREYQNTRANSYVGIDGTITTYEKDGETYDRIITDKSSSYIKATSYNNAFNDIYNRSDFRLFVEYLSKHTKKECKRKLSIVVFGMLCNGYTTKEIAKTTKKNESVISKIKKYIQDVYSEFSKTHSIDIFRHENNFNGVRFSPADVSHEFKFDTFNIRRDTFTAKQYTSSIDNYANKDIDLTSARDILSDNTIKDIVKSAELNIIGSCGRTNEITEHENKFEHVFHNMVFETTSTTIKVIDKYTDTTGIEHNDIIRIYKRIK